LHDLDPCARELAGIHADVPLAGTPAHGQHRLVVGVEQPVARLPGRARGDQGVHQRQPVAVARRAQRADVERGLHRALAQAWDHRISGSSSSPQTRRRNFTASSPSTTRWSKPIAAFIIGATTICPFRTMGRSTILCTPRMATSGTLMTGEELIAPKTPA